MAWQGADPEQLASLGRTLKNQMVSIEGVISTVTSAFGVTLWEGPAKEQFRNDWDTVFRATLNRLNQAFESAGSECINRSSALVQSMT